jgi:hypothetical protein
VCEITDSGQCVQTIGSQNQIYVGTTTCTITVLTAATLQVDRFYTEVGSGTLTVNGISYSNSIGPSSVQVFAGNEMTWSAWPADTSAVGSGAVGAGFKICGTPPSSSQYPPPTPAPAAPVGGSTVTSCLSLGITDSNSCWSRCANTGGAWSTSMPGTGECNCNVGGLLCRETPAPTTAADASSGNGCTTTAFDNSVTYQAAPKRVQAAVGVICSVLGLVSFAYKSFCGEKSEGPNCMTIQWAKNLVKKEYWRLAEEFAKWNGCCWSVMSQHSILQICVTKNFMSDGLNALAMAMYKVVSPPS